MNDKPNEGHRKPQLSPGVVNGIATAVTAIWALSFLADIILNDYSPPANVHMAFMLIVGAIFGSQFVRREV